jgi:hypothetical protein
MNRSQRLALLAPFALAACATAPLPVPEPERAESTDAAALYAALTGDFDNLAQYDAAPDALKRRPGLDVDWLDRQYARFLRIDAPAFGDVVFYLEWRSGGPGGPVSRQRIWRFRTDERGDLRMDFYAFLDGKPWEGRGDEAGAFSALSLEALRGYGSDCALRFVPRRDGGWQGEITAEQCVIVAASGRSMGINARIEIEPDGTLLYSESGVLPDGRYAFEVPPTEPYRFEPVRR